LGKGSEFIVTLPLARPTSPIASERVTEGRRPGEDANQRRVLVVDDNVDAAESLAIILRLHGHEARTVHDGEHAIEVACEFRPDVVLLDLGMPKVNGYEVARRLRSEPWGRHVVLVACTGWGQPEDRRRSNEAGFDHHLVKPVNPDAILGVVGSAASRPDTRSDAPRDRS
jgi:CheY-like chemotaxis protein